MTPPSTAHAGDMTTQLEALYAERELLERSLGMSSAEDLVAAFRSLEAQLASLYDERARA